MFSFVMKPFSTLVKKIKDECSTIMMNYAQIKCMENEKLMIPNIRRAFNCLKLQLIITSFFFGCYDLTFSSIQDFIVTLTPIFIMISFVLFIFRCASSWLDKALSKNKVVQATNVYFVANIYVVLIVTFNFKFLTGYTDIDRSICLVICILWIIHSFNLVPGLISIKISLYLGVSFLLLLILKPKFGYGYVLIISHLIAYIVQIYIVWEKYHEECLILNKVEYEKNVNEFLYNQFPEAIFTLNAQLEIQKMNEKGLKILNICNKTSFKDLALELLSEKGKSLYSNLSELSQKNYEIENQPYSRKNEEDNSYLKLIISSSSFEIESKKIVIVIIKDLTEFFKKQEKHITERCQNILLLSAPHEIRSQLNLIYGNLEQLEKKFDLFLLRLAKYAAKVMEYKLNLLFDFASIVTEKFAEHPKLFNFKALAEDAGEILKIFAKAKNLKFSMKYASKSTTIKGDYERFFAILIHCGLNAIKYSNEGLVLLKIKFKNGYLMAKIIDNGIGIKGPIVNHINNYFFNPFGETSNLLKNALNCLENSKFLSGIGSLSSSFICKKLGGSFHISYEENQGTVVNFKIQCSSVNESLDEIEDESCIQDSARSPAMMKIEKYKFCTNIEITSNPKSEPQNIKNPSNHLKILVVDDQAFNRMTIINMLKTL